MNEKTAINILTQAVKIGQEHGIYSIKDSAMIFQALCVLNPELENPVEKEEEPKEK